MSESSAERQSIKSRLVEELWKYLIVSLYLFICFGIILIYEASQSSAREATLLTGGAVLIDALIVGKFLLIGEALQPGARIGAPTLLHRVAWRTLGLLIVLVILKLLEELVIGLVHGNGILEITDELLQRPWIAFIGPTLLMLLILIPLMTAIELDRALGDDGLKGLLLKPADS